MSTGTALALNSATHSLSIGSTTYYMDKAPDSQSPAVLAAKQEILHDLSLSTVLEDLNRAADLMFIAYNGVSGSGNDAASISQRQKDLGDLCEDCVATMETIRESSRDVIGNLTLAFKYLLKADEKHALKILAQCAEKASDMAGSCGALAARFGTLKDATAADCSSLEVAIGGQRNQLDALKALKGEMEATLAKQKKINTELNSTIEQLKEDIAEAKEQEAIESERAFAMGIVGAVTGAIGAGIGVFAATQNPVPSAVAKLQSATAPAAAAPAAAGESKETTDAKKAKSDADKEVAAKKKVADDAKVALETADAAVKTASSDCEAKEKAAETSGKSGAAAQKKADDAALEKAQTTLSDAKKDQRTASDAKERADRDMDAALKGAGTAATELARTLNQMSDAAVSRAGAERSLRMELLSQKRKMEAENRTSLGLIAEISCRLSASDTKERLDESCLAALEISKVALDNIWVALSNAKFFWDGMAAFCKKLSKPEALKKLDLVSDDEPEDRIAFYSSEDFMPTAVFYLIRWTALAAVGDDYVTASVAARAKVLANINKSPNREDARKNLPALKAHLQTVIETDQAQSAKRLAAIETEQHLLAEVR